MVTICAESAVLRTMLLLVLFAPCSQGAVACHLQDLSAEDPLDLLLVNCHLYGTNKYGVPEAFFDKVPPC